MKEKLTKRVNKQRKRDDHKKIAELRVIHASRDCDLERMSIQ